MVEELAVEFSLLEFISESLYGITQYIVKPQLPPGVRLLSGVIIYGVTLLYDYVVTFSCTIKILNLFYNIHTLTLYQFLNCLHFKPSRDFTRLLGTPSGLKGLLHMLNATVIPTKVSQVFIFIFLFQVLCFWQLCDFRELKFAHQAMRRHVFQHDPSIFFKSKIQGSSRSNSTFPLYIYFMYKKDFVQLKWGDGSRIIYLNFMLPPFFLVYFEKLCQFKTFDMFFRT